MNFYTRVSNDWKKIKILEKNPKNGGIPAVDKNAIVKILVIV